MPHAMSNFAAAVLESTIYTIGGYNGLGRVGRVERFDIASRMWYRARSIAESGSASAACIVEDVAMPASWPPCAVITNLWHVCEKGTNGPQHVTTLRN